MHSDEFEKDYASKVERINKALSRLGWVVNPHHVVGLDLNDLMGIVESIENGSLAIDQAGYDRVCGTVQQCIFHPRYRAFYLWRATQLPPLRRIGHYLERAHLRFFSRDYFSTALLLLTALEGAMREHVGYTYPNGDHRRILRLIERRSSSTTGAFAGRYELYRRWLLFAIEQWVFKGTEQARRDHALDLTAAFRGNALHGETAGAFYAAADCTRLFALFDLYVETLTCETGLGYANFIPENGANKFVDDRDAIYARLLFDSNLVAQQLAEERLMVEHPSYVAEVRQRDIAEIVVTNALDYQRRFEQMLADIRAGKIQVH
jgi:hypothetical protein